MRAIQVGQSVFYRGGGRLAAEWREAARELLDQKRPFLAYDLTTMGLAAFPGDIELTQLAARALIQADALDEARALLEPLVGADAVAPAAIESIQRSVRATLEAEGEDAVRGATELVRELARAVRTIETGHAADEETLGLIGRVYKGLWQRGEHAYLRLARDAYLRAFRATGGTWTAINAASLSWILGARDHDSADRSLANELAKEISSALAPPADDYWELATVGEARLLRGELDAALESYTRAVGIGGRDVGKLDSSRRQLAMLRRAGLEIPGAILGSGDERGLLDPPIVVYFVGHLLDRDNGPRRFPADAEESVRRALVAKLDELDARIGYSSAASGADLLFAEAMHARGAEINVVLPFRDADFRHRSVRPAGQSWERRYQRALRSASELHCVTEEECRAGGDELFEFGAAVTHGLARIRAAQLGTRPHLVAVWDGRDHSGPGGTAQCVRAWPDPDRMEVIRLDELGVVESRAEGPTEEPGRDADRAVKTMLFADVVGYSKLAEADTPAYVHTFLERVAEELRNELAEPPTLNTWGDAIFVVMDQTAPMLDYARALRDCVHGTDWRELGLSSDIDIRIAVHAGPVFCKRDPLTGRANVYGSHVNRVARIEPITRPGCIYASEQFVGLWAHEVPGALENDSRFSAEYVGTVPLAKDFGEQSLYHMRPR